MGLPANTLVKKQIDEFIRRWTKFPVSPERRANPARAQNTVDGEDINPFDILPLFRLNDGDGGFISIKRALSPRSARPRSLRQTERRDLPYGSEGDSVSSGLQPVPMHDIALHLHKAKSAAKTCRLPLRWVTIRSSP